MTIRPSSTRKTASRAGVQQRTMLSVVMQFRVVVRSMRRHYQSVERAVGVTGAQLWAMAEIDASPQMTVGQLARDLAIHQSTASNIVADLEAAGLITRERPREDQRVVRLALTAAGRRIMRRAPRPLRGALQEALMSLPPARLSALHRDLAAVIAHLDGGDPDARHELLSQVIVRS
ncbi:MAG TPA: MarR family winged helix-turn-helix transcriptional regulator [Casimicrobiaceae bacterium]|nr:MarR family winged helix-turn-helix transcriptional regulator [Casimicrobiaceae bacterium]